MEIKLLEKELEEKDELIQTLQGQMELLRKQMIMMKTTGKRSNTQLDITQDIETQTSPNGIANGRCRSLSSSSSKGNSTKQACCVIL